MVALTLYWALGPIATDVVQYWHLFDPLLSGALEEHIPAGRVQTKQT